MEDGCQFQHIQVKDVSFFRVLRVGIGLGSTFSLQKVKSSCVG